MSEDYKAYVEDQALVDAVRVGLIRKLRNPDLFTAEEIDEAVFNALHITAVDIAIMFMRSKGLCDKCGWCCRKIKSIALN